MFGCIDAMVEFKPSAVALRCSAPPSAPLAEPEPEEVRAGPDRSDAVAWLSPGDLSASGSRARWDKRLIKAVTT